MARFAERLYTTRIGWLPAHVAVPIFLAATSVLSLQVQVGSALFPQSAATTFGLQIVILAVSLPGIRFPKDRITWLACGALFALVLWAFLSAIWSPLPITVLMRGVLILLPSLGLFLLTATDGQPKKTFRYTSIILYVIAIALTCIALLISIVSAGFNAIEFDTSQSVNVHQLVISQRVLGSGWPTTVSSLTHSPNTFAVWVMFGIIATWGAYRVGHLRHSIMVIYMMVFSFGLWMSFSLTAIGSTIIAMTAIIVCDRDGAISIKCRLSGKTVLLAFTLIAVLILAGVTILPGVADTIFFNRRVFYDDADGMTKTASWRILFYFSVIAFLAAVTALYLFAHGRMRRNGKLKPSQTIVAGSLFIVAVAGALLVILPVVDNIYSAMFLEGRNGERITLWGNLIKLLFAKPAIGDGFGVSFESIILANNMNVGFHSIYLTVLAEIGIIGLVLFLAFCGIPVFVLLRILVAGSCGRKCSNREYRGGVISCIFGFLVAILVHQLFELGILRFNSMNFFWVAFLGQGLALCRVIPER
ncbi:MAG: hypothetical protein CL573_04135 [Alphaproteobacteria bacterium]|nr:hypothetical protein [Alphaproteobacteria bacterium]